MDTISIGVVSIGNKINGQPQIKSDLSQLSLVLYKGLPKSWAEFGNYEELYLTKNKISNYPKTFIKGRDITNPFELIKSGKRFFKVPKIDVISRAYFKLWEILMNFNLIDDVPNFLYAGLAESPGGFLQAVYDYRKNMKTSHKVDISSDIFFGISLRDEQSIKWEKSLLTSKQDSKQNQYFDDIGKIFINYGDPKFNDGNLLNPANILAFANKIPRKASLVTADGGIGIPEGDTDIENFKEQMHTQLFYNEIVAAFLILKKGGNFVIKMYDLYTIPSAQMIKVLVDNFQKVSIVKPVTSRPASSEKYIVCEKFLGSGNGYSSGLLNVSRELFNKLSDIPIKKDSTYIHSFNGIKFSMGLIERIKKINDYLSGIQIKILNLIFRMLDLSKTNYQLYKRGVNNLYKKQIINAIRWCKEYNIPYLSDLEKI